jgi:ADP-ribose pyrophosphatase YjhB (NUDIX family)
MNATTRELHKETGLATRHYQHLFSYDDPEDSRLIRNLHKVFLIETVGRPRHRSGESGYIGYWKPGSSLHLSRTTKLLIENYLDWRQSRTRI